MFRTLRMFPTCCEVKQRSIATRLLIERAGVSFRFSFSTALRTLSVVFAVLAFAACRPPLARASENLISISICFISARSARALAAGNAAAATASILLWRFVNLANSFRRVCSRSYCHDVICAAISNCSRDNIGHIVRSMGLRLSHRSSLWKSIRVSELASSFRVPATLTPRNTSASCALLPRRCADRRDGHNASPSPASCARAPPPARARSRRSSRDRTRRYGADRESGSP